MSNLFKEVVTSFLNKPDFARSFSKATRVIRDDIFSDFKIRKPIFDNDFKDIVKGTHKFLANPSSAKKKGLSNKDVEKMAAALKDYCNRNPYKLAVASVKSKKHDEMYTKVCGAVGLMVDADEVQKFAPRINDRKWMPRVSYALVCNLYVLIEARRRGMATALVTEAIRLAKSEGAKIVYSIIDTTRKGTRTVHEDLGFKEIVKSEDGKEALLAKAM